MTESQLSSPTIKWILIISFFLEKKKKIGKNSENAKVGLVYVTGISSEMLFILSYTYNLNMDLLGIPWWSSGQDSALPQQGIWGLIPGRGTKILQAAQCGQITMELFLGNKKTHIYLLNKYLHSFYYMPSTVLNTS